MKKKSKSIIICFIVVAILVILDQLSKIAVRNCFGDGSSFVIWDGVLKLLFTKNSGAAWGIFKNQTWILACISLLMSALMIFCYIKLPETKRFKPLKISILFVIAGAIGNGIDRFVFQYVTDFIYFELIDFPVFNVADCYITVAMFVLVFLLIFYYKDDDFDRLKNKKSEVDDTIFLVNDPEADEEEVVSEIVLDDEEE